MSGSPTVAFVTYAKLANLHEDDRLAADVLAARGVTVVPALWDDPTVDWRAFDLVVIRTPWDYFQRPTEYFAWLNALDGANVCNARAVLRWNADKTYLRDLAAHGVATLPTLWLTHADDLAALPAQVAAHAWDQVVIKPAIAGGAFHTWRTSAAVLPADLPRIAELLRHSTVLVQPFAPQIVADGEWSLIFFDGLLSHTILKRPQADDFRVQPQFGGTSAAAPAPDAAIAHARHVLDIAQRLTNSALLYARVDGVMVDGVFTLMELEVIEPLLFLALGGGAQRFADAILARLGVAA
jgi:hypothetical protein